MNKWKKMIEEKEKEVLSGEIYKKERKKKGKEKNTGAKMMKKEMKGKFFSFSVF